MIGVMDGQQLDRGHAERAQVLDHRIGREAEVRAAQVLGHVRMHARSGPSRGTRR